MPIVFFILLLVLSFFVIKPLLLAIFLGALLAYIAYPIYKLSLKRINNKTISSLLVCLLVFLVFVIPLTFLVKSLVQESYVIYLLVKQKLAVGLFRNCENTFCEAIRAFGHNEFVNTQIKEWIKTITNWVIQKGSYFLISLPKIVLNLFVTFLTLFYFLKDGDELLRKLNHYFSSHQKNYLIIISRLKEILHGVVYGYLLIALIQGFFGALGFFIFGISSPLFWGVIMAFLALIPVLGTGVIWVPASLILLLDGIFQDSTTLVVKGIALFVYSFIFVGSVDNFLRPKLIGQKAKVHTAIIMFGIFGGILMFGPLGVIIGPIVLSLTAEVIDLYLSNKNSKKNEKKE
ncbi:MAG: AI-2E family transporter [Nanoarchaeota archaeon]